MSTGYEYWQAKLAGSDPEPPEDRTQMPLGFWRMRDNSPLAVWMEGELRIALRGFAEKSGVMPVEYMERVAEQGGFGSAVTEEAYREAFAAGRWPDTDPTVASQVGHNRPPNDDDPEVIREQIEAAQKSAAEYAEISDDETAARAQSLRARITELKGRAEKAHKTEKEPHLKAGKAVDAKWLPLAKQADEAAKKIRAAIEKHETRKLIAERQRQEEERRAAEAKAQETGKPEPLFPTPAEPPAPTKLKGGYGRAATIKTVNVVTDITDAPALFRWLHGDLELRDLMVKLAQRAVDAGQDVPGVTIEPRRKVA